MNKKLRNVCNRCNVCIVNIVCRVGRVYRGRVDWEDRVYLEYG